MFFLADCTISPEQAAEFTAPTVIVVTDRSATLAPSPEFLLHLLSGTVQHQSLLDEGSVALISAAEVLEVSMSLEIDEDHERYAARILAESRKHSNSVKL